ncbi:MAG TPA: hypothetical protein VD834_16570 [Blastococcus sp.]|nr:hypothetical protein [Nocardioides sp.]HYH26961.1 hypothetical protein [Blastococcus sp.]
MAIETFPVETFDPGTGDYAEWDGDNHEELADWLSANDSYASPWSVGSVDGGTLTLRRGVGSTPEATLTMQVGDWIEPDQPTVYDAAARANMVKLDQSGRYRRLADLLPPDSDCPVCLRPLS